MSELTAFFKENKKAKQNEFFAASKDFTGADGKPLLWELRHVPTITIQRIESECTTIKKGGVASVDMVAFQKKKMAAAVVFPDLKNAELIDNYMSDYPLDQRTPENLLPLMLNDPYEYRALAAKIAEMENINPNELIDKIEIAKN